MTATSHAVFISLLRSNFGNHFSPISSLHIAYMSSQDIAEEIRNTLPGTEEIVVQYLSGYLVDEASEDDDILQVARLMLDSVAMGKESVVEQLMGKLGKLLQDQLTARENDRSGPKLQRLDKVMDMSKAGAMSNTIAFTEGVDLESINKGKCVAEVDVRHRIFLIYNFWKSISCRCQET